MNIDKVVIGTSERRLGGHARVTGGQQFVGDIKLERMLHVKLVHLDCGHARIVSIDTAKAEQVPGVVSVVTAADLPQPMPRYGPVFADRPILAVGETKYHGQAVAAVAAETREAAEAAAELVRVEHEELPGVYTVAAALDPASPLVQEPELRRDDPLKHTNVLRERRFGWGDVHAARADLVVENVYAFPMVTHFAIEPHAFIAAPEDGGLVIWTATQNPFQMQRILAGVLGLPVAKVRVLAPDPGGAFGGKQHPKYEPLVALLALRTGRPVRLLLTLEETFQEVRRTSCEIHARTGFNADGTISFQDIHSDFLMGAYADIAERVIAKSNYLACGPYRVPNARIVVRALFSHTTPSTAFRGFGTPQVSWAHESQMDDAARRLGIDRVEIRLRNLARKGEAFVPGDTPADGDWAESVRKAAAAIDWGTPLAAGRGRGLAIAIKASATTGASYSIVRLHWDGSATVLAGTSDMGQGARTVLAQIAANELGIPVDWTAVVMGDTASVPFDLQTSASRSTVFMGNAVKRACEDVRAQLRQTAAELFGLDASDVTVEPGLVRIPGRTISFVELLRARFSEVRGEVIGVGSMRSEHQAEHPLGGSPSFYEFTCTASEVEVDQGTGEILLVRHVTVADVGKALNPQHVEMQDEGAAVMGLGHTLMEHMILDDSGRIRNLGALDYRIPTTKDLPLDMHSLIVENADGPGPYGAKGAGEGGLMATAPAVASAVTEACGAVIRDLPLSPERVWRAIQSSPPHRGEVPPGSRSGPRGGWGPMSYVYALDHRHDLPEADQAALIGGKGAGLAMMTTELGLPVPPGFTITTEACRAFLSMGWPAGLDDELTNAMRRLEGAVGRRFGDPTNPLLVSVRSGAPVSMPGMMDTILNLGLNDQTTRGLAGVSGDPSFASDSRRRLMQMFTKVVGAATVPDDPWQQLRTAIEAVFRSWNSERARAYRSHERIPDDLGTAVTVQAMVFGNWGPDSATGVMFTRNPATGEQAIYGDVLFASQGEDVVAGTHRTEPLTVLDTRLPEIARELRRYADLLERNFADMCDIEFTIEQGKLWLLQVRVGKRSPGAALRIAFDMAEADDFPLSRAQAVERVTRYLTHPPTISTGRRNDVPALATGLPASPGVASGEIATSSAAAIAAADAFRPVILVRSETSPDDVPGMARSQGVLTSRGGLASHAAVVARGWGIPAVVGAEAVKVRDHGVDVGGHPLKVGDTITIDGGTGEIFAGMVTGSTTVVPEASTLLAWAKELGIAIVSDGNPAVPGDALVTAVDLVRALVIKGSATPDALAAAMLSSVEKVRPVLDGLLAEDLIEPEADGFRLTGDGKARGQTQIAEEKLQWGRRNAEAALDAFVALDHRVKEAVTAWQVREVGGVQAINDHADAAYDAVVLDQLAGLHHDAVEWLMSLREQPASLIQYRFRLERALESANGGDQRFVASPRVDSYHGIWFELHEDLILLAGRSRAEETAAGRA